MTPGFRGGVNLNENGGLLLSLASTSSHIGLADKKEEVDAFFLFLTGAAFFLGGGDCGCDGTGKEVIISFLTGGGEGEGDK